MDIVSYKCPHCGGGLTFDPESGQYQCDYCLSQFTQQEMDAMTPRPDEEARTDGARPNPESGLGSAADGASREEGGAAADETSQAPMLYTCPSCGAEIVTDETTAATFCFYCHNPIVLSGRLDGQYHPDYVLPFAVDKEKAVSLFTDWIRKKRYVPKAFFSEDQIEKMTGVYFPYWLYSCEVEGTLDAEGVKLRTWVSGNLQYTETQKYDIKRNGVMKIDHVSRNALKKADKQLVESVLPFDFKELRPFSMGYLSGFMAEKRDMEQKEFAPELEKEVRVFAESGLASDVTGYSRLSVRQKSTDIRDENWQYALMPVWTLTYRDRDGSIYYFACNGQTGKICGKLPVDMGRLWVLFAEIFFPLLLFMLVVGYFI